VAGLHIYPVVDIKSGINPKRAQLFSRLITCAKSVKKAPYI
jgi:hypothetical protein